MRIRHISLVFAAACFAMCIPIAFPWTQVSGVIPGNTTWTLDNSPYVVDGSIMVPNGFFLTIEPGVTVLMALDTELHIEGTLWANGTRQNPIAFKRKTPDERWHRIRIRTTGAASLHNCIITGSKHGITLHDTSAGSYLPNRFVVGMMLQFTFNLLA